MNRSIPRFCNLDLINDQTGVVSVIVTSKSTINLRPRKPVFEKHRTTLVLPRFSHVWSIIKKLDLWTHSDAIYDMLFYH